LTSVAKKGEGKGKDRGEMRGGKRKRYSIPANSLTYHQRKKHPGKKGEKKRGLRLLLCVSGKLDVDFYFPSRNGKKKGRREDKKKRGKKGRRSP